MDTQRTRMLRLSCLALASVAVMGLSACGGGGSSGSGNDADDTAAATPAPSPSPSAVDPTPSPTTITLSGVAATGAAFSGASLTVTDKNGTEVGSVPSIGTDGSYSVTLASGATAPFVLVAKRDDVTLVSVQETAESSTVNVTPITTLVASRLSPSGDPAKLAEAIRNNEVTVDKTAVANKVSEVKTLLQPLLEATGTHNDDLLHGTFNANGTGQDKLLDSLNITITPDSSSSANIQVAVRQKVSDDSQAPAAITFKSSESAPPKLPTVDSTTLLQDGASVLIADLMKRVNACFALPVAERVNNTTSSAAAANVVAAACTSLFVDNNPATFLNNGARVAYNGAFGGLFKAGGNNIDFSRGTYEFSRANGDLVISYVVNNPNSGSTDSGSLVARKVSTSDGKAELKLIGNQYAYDGGVSAYHQLRRFITLSQSDYNYYSSGFSLNVSNVTDGNGQSIFDRVVITTPKGSTLTLKPLAGSSYLGLVRANGTVTNTSFLRLQSSYVNSQTSGHPSDRDTSVFFTKQEATEADISGLSPHSVWKFDYYLASAPTVLAASQSYKTLARPLSVGELKKRGMAQLTDKMVTDIGSEVDATTGNVPLPSDGQATLEWTVPTGALAPTNLKLWGRTTGGSSMSFNDQVNVTSAARSGTITCSAQTSADTHCTTNAGVTTFAAGSMATGVHLWAREPNGRELSTFYAMYKLTTPQ